MKRKLILFLSSFLLGIGMMTAQVSVKGIVVDENGEPVPGASIQLKSNKGYGTATDMDGRFTLSVPEGATLIISYIGTVTQEVSATPDMRIVLKSESQQLQEVASEALDRSPGKRRP